MIVKDIRSELRLYSGRFQKSSKDRERLFQENKLNELLQTHTSTSERMDFYPKLKEIISSLKVRSILDLGCGLNPIALAEKDITYYASDIKEDELFLIDNHFKKKGIKGKTFVLDLTSNIDFDNLPEVDLCIIFKVLDIIEKKNHKVAESLLMNIKAKYFLLSFSTKKLSGRQMNNPKRYWLEKLLKYKSISYSTFSSDNEIFYLIKKSLQQNICSS